VEYDAQTGRGTGRTHPEERGSDPCRAPVPAVDGRLPPRTLRQVAESRVELRLAKTL
jgi:hypothetical protein